MTASDDDVVLRLPFPVACELEAYLSALDALHQGTDLVGEMAVSATRMRDALRRLRQAMVPAAPGANVVPLRPRGAR